MTGTEIAAQALGSQHIGRRVTATYPRTRVHNGKALPDSVGGVVEAVTSNMVFVKIAFAGGAEATWFMPRKKMFGGVKEEKDNPTFYLQD